MVCAKDLCFGEMYRKSRREAMVPEVCEVCGNAMEMDPESLESRCPACEEVER